MVGGMGFPNSFEPTTSRPQWFTSVYRA